MSYEVEFTHQALEPKFFTFYEEVNYWKDIANGTYTYGCSDWETGTNEDGDYYLTSESSGQVFTIADYLMLDFAKEAGLLNMATV